MNVPLHMAKRNPRVHVNPSSPLFQKGDLVVYVSADCELASSGFHVKVLVSQTLNSYLWYTWHFTKVVGISQSEYCGAFPSIFSLVCIKFSFFFLFQKYWIDANSFETKDNNIWTKGKTEPLWTTSQEWNIVIRCIELHTLWLANNILTNVF